MNGLGEYQAPAALERFKTIFLGAGGIALIVWAIGVYMSPEQGLRSWLLGYIFWGGITIGSLGVIMLQYLTGGAWGVVIRRIVEAASRTLPMMIILFIPLIFIQYYHYWTTWPADDYAIVHRGWFMTQESWILRSFIYFLLFYVIMHLLNKWGEAQDKATDHEAAAKWLGRATAFSGPTMVFYVLIVTFATVDWVMMLDAHWFSTIWGLLFVAGWALSCFSFCVVVLMYLSDKAPMNAVLGKRHFHDLGKLMLAFTMVWAYFNFSQFLIIWSGNIPEETGWYLVRMKGGWMIVGTLLVLFHFAFPFLILLQQDFKRKAKWLASLAVFILLMRLVDMFYLVAPNPRIDKAIEKGAFVLSWMDIVAPIAIGGLWLWLFLVQYTKRPIMPVMDPFLENAIKHGKGH
ncbi:MAG TPA: hypothetical protein PKD24_07040 [Pyrinomonadaceae bacterium]|nr:hypothetical protein [Pyrinomonadaceae bacterium]HMP65086.1 hypothetical protein [Pyrinomonadaceae bacterium]